jgi:hypothetical protein
MSTTFEDNPNAGDLANFLRAWLRGNPRWAYTPGVQGTQFRTAREIAVDLSHAMTEADLRVAEWFESPDGELIAAVVVSVLPWPQSWELSLLVEAVTLAAQKRNKNQKVSVGLTGVALVLVLALLFWLFDSN